MGRIVSGDRVYRDLPAPIMQGPRQQGEVGSRIQARISIKEAGKHKQFHIIANRKDKIATIQADLALVREHFGSSISEALRLALHLTANAIRKNVALPEVKWGLP